MIVSSHILPELEDLADRYAVMVDGRWAEVAPGKTFFTRDELRHGFGGGRRELRVSGGGDEIARASAALDAAGVAYEVETAGGLNGAVLEILGHGN